MTNNKAARPPEAGLQTCFWKWSPTSPAGPAPRPRRNTIMAPPRGGRFLTRARGPPPRGPVAPGFAALVTSSLAAVREKPRDTGDLTWWLCSVTSRVKHGKTPACEPFARSPGHRWLCNAKADGMARRSQLGASRFHAAAASSAPPRAFHRSARAFSGVRRPCPVTLQSFYAIFLAR